VRPFDDDLEAYRRRLLSREEAAPERGNGSPAASDPRRNSRRYAAERRIALEPLRRKSRQAEQTAARLADEQRVLDSQLAIPGAFGDRGQALADALKRRAELARLISDAEAAWIEAESEIERMTQG